MSGGLLPALTSLGGVEGDSRRPGFKVPQPLDGAPQTGSLQMTSPRDHAESAQQRGLADQEMHRHSAPCGKPHLKASACWLEKLTNR